MPPIRGIRAFSRVPNWPLACLSIESGTTSVKRTGTDAKRCSRRAGLPLRRLLKARILPAEPTSRPSATWALKSPLPTSAEPQRSSAVSVLVDCRVGALQTGSPSPEMTPLRLISTSSQRSGGGWLPSVVAILPLIATLTGAGSERGSECGAKLASKATSRPSTIVRSALEVDAQPTTRAAIRIGMKRRRRMLPGASLGRRSRGQGCAIVESVLVRVVASVAGVGDAFGPLAHFFARFAGGREGLLFRRRQALARLAADHVPEGVLEAHGATVGRETIFGPLLLLRAPIAVAPPRPG